MAPILTFFNNKGGVGKSTAAINVAHAMARIGKSVVVADCDSQRNSYRYFVDVPDDDYSGVTRYDGINIAFAEAMSDVPQNADFILIDCPPALESAAYILGKCDYVFVPIELGTFPIQGIAKVTEEIATTGTRFGGCFVNKFDKDNPSDHKLEEMLRKTLGSKVMTTRIPYSRVIKNSISYRQTAFEYSPKSKATKSYSDLTLEIINICMKGDDNA
jgi:chromosome partitioning protein